MSLRQLLLGGASRAALSPQTDNEGGDYEDEDDVSGAGAEFDDEDDGDTDGGDVDSAEADLSGGQDDDLQEGEVEPEPKPLSRAERRVQAALTTAKAAEERAARIESELAALKAERTRGSTEDAQAAERQRLEMMSPDERADYRISQLERTLKADLEQTKFNIWDQADKASFETTLAQRSDLPKNAAAEVEKYLAQMRAAGTNAPRATVLRYVIGDLVLAAAPKARARAERGAEENRRRQEVSPPRGRASIPAAGSRRSGANTPEGREARLADRLL